MSVDGGFGTRTGAASRPAKAHRLDDRLRPLERQEVAAHLRGVAELDTRVGRRRPVHGDDGVPRILLVGQGEVDDIAVVRLPEVRGERDRDRRPRGHGVGGVVEVQRPHHQRLVRVLVGDRKERHRRELARAVRGIAGLQVAPAVP